MTDAAIFEKPEDQTRLKGLRVLRCPGSRLTANLLELALEGDDPRSAASALSVSWAKGRLSEQIARQIQVDKGVPITLIPAFGLIKVADVSPTKLKRLKRALRAQISRSGACRKFPGAFGFDFTFRGDGSYIAVHFHGIVHRSDADRIKALRTFKAFRSREDCRKPVVISKAAHPNGPQGFIEYMVKSCWVMKPSYWCKTKHALRYGQKRRAPSPYFERFLINIAPLTPDELIFRIGGGSGRR